MTDVLHLDPEQPDQKVIEHAASIIRNGGLVAFPTETVYGLGANAMDEGAVQKIFQAKGRPADNPLIAHVCSREMLDLVTTGLSETAERLIREFWPGPLTLVLDRNPQVAKSVSVGLPTVAVRMPGTSIALELIRASRTPIAAPSANASGKPSPTTAAHVLDDLDGRIDLILDGGTTNIGIESTVLDMTIDPPVILRPGWITRAMLTEIIGVVEHMTSGEQLRHSPGTRHRHYTPRARVILVEGGSPEFIERLCGEHLKEGAVGFIGYSGVAIDDPRLHIVQLPNRAADYAHSIYSALRELDALDPKVILVEGISDEDEGAAVMDRLRRAASQSITSG